MNHAVGELRGKNLSLLGSVDDEHGGRLGCVGMTEQVVGQLLDVRSAMAFEMLYV